jgi:predicted nucleic acid-binding Zn ribbon protein
LKGTGWYVTDYPKKSDAPLAKRDKTGEAVVKADSEKKESAGGKETPAKAAAGEG